MRNKLSVYALYSAVFLVASLVLVPLAGATASITLTPNSYLYPGESILVAGTEFGSSKAVVIGLFIGGNVVDYNMNYTGTGIGPYSGVVSSPVFPGSFTLFCDTTSGGGLVSTYTDNGDGTLTGPLEGDTGTIDYVTGAWSRSTTVDVMGIATNYTATYMSMQLIMTSPGSVTTSVSGTFSASVYVPHLPNEIYNVTAIDAEGHWATAPFGLLMAVPAGLTTGVVVLLSSVAVVASAVCVRKSRINSLNKARI